MSNRQPSKPAPQVGSKTYHQKAMQEARRVVELSLQQRAQYRRAAR
jgi:hypothetical protein